METTYEENLKRKLEENKKRIEEARKAKADQNIAEREKKALTNPAFTMNKLSRLTIAADETYFMLPMHKQELAVDLLIHTPKLEVNGRERYMHLVCTDIFKANSCPHCKTYDKMTSIDAAPGDAKNAWKYNGRHVKCSVMYVFNTIGSKRTFTAADGEEVTYFLNPAQNVEIPAEASGKDKVLSLFEAFDKKNMFEDTIWAIRRKAGVKDMKGITRGAGFEQTTNLSEEELTDRLGKEGVEPVLPAFAKAWSDSIKTISAKSKQEAKDTILKYLLTSFDNGEEIAEIKGWDLPKRPDKSEKNVSSVLNV